jgi:MoaA/NifB/PqqE/SkfB family radical SAM enzyme
MNSEKDFSDTTIVQKGAPGEDTKEFLTRLSFPMEISYFLNNVCNLRCKHCYVGTTHTVDRLMVTEWQDIFKRCMALGALTFGNVGKEPTLVWENTIELLRWFKLERRSLTRLRYGIVTNGILLDNKRIKELAEAEPTYVDVSFDGDEVKHNYIRGIGCYQKTRANLIMFPPELKKHTFISFTANALNLETLPTMLDDLYQIGIRQFLISPYVSTQIGKNDGWKELVIDGRSIVSFIRSLLDGELFLWNKYENLHIYLKCDYTTSREVMDDLEKAGIIRLDELMIDDYGVIFNRYQFGSNTVYFNYIPFDDTLVRSVRFSHDGYVSSCYDMFFDDQTYRQRAAGNVRQEPLEVILHKFLLKE